jgi:hypothetical protein
LASNFCVWNWTSHLSLEKNESVMKGSRTSCARGEGGGGGGEGEVMKHRTSTCTESDEANLSGERAGGFACQKVWPLYEQVHLQQLPCRA